MIIEVFTIAGCSICLPLNSVCIYNQTEYENGICDSAQCIIISRVSDVWKEGLKHKLG